MTPREALSRAEEVAALAGYNPDLLSKSSFLTYSQQVAYAAKALTAKQRESIPWFKSWVLEWRKLYDSFDTQVEADPMMLYRPANKASLDFHKSNAFIRYFRAGNRTSKTQSGYAEHYFVTTGQHKWREFPDPMKTKIATFIIGLAYSKYAPAVFEAKLIKGETGNTLSPMFPPGGKWFYNYNERSKTLQIACPECAEAGKAGSCRHKKSEIRLFSDEGGWEVLQGAQYIVGHFDEHVAEEFYSEAKMRLSVVRGSSMLITGTPLHGTEAWEQRRVVSLYKDGPPRNLSDINDPNSPPIVTLHEIDQFHAGLVSHEVIRRNMADMDEFEIEARIYGRPTPLTKNPVFDRKALSEIRNQVRPPMRGVLRVAEDGIDLNEVIDTTTIKFIDEINAPLRIWEMPEERAQYVIGVDTAKGLTSRDASCASVLKFDKVGTSIQLDLVAQYHGWINPLLYAEEVFKLAVFYNSALVAIELTGGYGEAVMLRLRQDFCYWNIFRDETSHAQTKHRMAFRYGVETNARSKPFMVAALQQFVRERAISIPCSATIEEMAAFEQIRPENNDTLTKYRGASGSSDDRTMSMVIAASVAVSTPVFDHLAEFREKSRLEDIYDGDWLKLHKELRDNDPEKWYDS